MPGGGERGVAFPPRAVPRRRAAGDRLDLARKLPLFNQFDHLSRKIVRALPIQGTIEDTRDIQPYEEVAKMLALANAHLKKKYAKAAPLTTASLQSAGVRRDGSKYVSFHRYGKKADGNRDGTYTNVVIQIKRNAEPKVTVRAKLK